MCKAFSFRRGSLLTIFGLAMAALTAQATTYILGAATRWEGPGAGTDGVIVAVSPLSGTWTAATNASWLHLSAANQAGTGSTNLVFTYDANTGGTRTNTLTIGTQTLTVIQAGATYAAAGSLTTLFTSGLSSPYSVKVDAAGNVYVADTFNGAVKEWMVVNNTVTTLVSGLNYPNDIALDSGANVYIADTSNGAVKKYNAGTKAVSTLVTAGLQYPDGIAVDAATNVYVADNGNNLLSKLPYGASTLVTMPSAGLNFPAGLAVDCNTNVYAANLAYGGVLELMSGASAQTTLIASGLGEPGDVAVDGAGNVYVTDSDNNAIKVLGAATHAVTSLGLTGLSEPEGVSLDAGGDLFIADSGNNAIKELPHVFVDNTARTESGSPGTDTLPTVLPATAVLTAPFAPTSDSAWLTISGATNGVVTYAFTANTGTNRTGHLTVYGKSIAVTQTVMVVRPTLTITNVAAGMVLTNAAFTVLGTTSNSVVVTNVSVSLNNGAWTNAVTTNSWVNWSAAIKLLPGTNLLAAYARDTNGNYSLTNSVSLVYALNATLTVKTNGLGSLSTNYNGSHLPIGYNFAITATPATGFNFTNWSAGTNGTLAVITNGPTVQFTMVSNLTLSANFADVQAPVVAITNLTAGQQLTAAAFTVKGTAGDNWRVTNVWLQLNGGAWTNATTANTWTNWSANLVLLPGTNTLAVYALDTSGNVSATNTVSFQYARGATLVVKLQGLGTVSPNDSNAVLNIGQNYAMTATPATGFVFTNWTGATNLPLVLITNGPTVQFTMVSNLTLSANFADVQAPVVAVTNLVSGQQLTNNTFALRGTASDNWQVTNVWWQLNGGSPTNAVTTNNWAAWSAAVTLAPGTNYFCVYGVDNSGNVSLTNTVAVQYAVGRPLLVSIAGLGTVSPNDSNAVLNLGQTYSMTATPYAGFVLSNWTGGTTLPLAVVTNGATLQFTMVSNLMLTANFADVQAPVAALTNLTAGQQVGTASFTAVGTAGDNWQVAGVWVKLNGCPWTNAVTTNSWACWAAPLNLKPGTNCLAYYAVDSSGNVSVTNCVAFQYAVGATLGVAVEGLGTLSPDDSNAVLNVGQNYSMTAAPAAGFAFAGWTVATNWSAGAVTNSATVQFTMVSNLTLTASFTDVQAPTLAITNLNQGDQTTNDVFTVTGTATDNWQVAAVWIQLNNAAWTNAVTTNGWANWSADLALVPGTNALSAYSVDSAGNVSTTNSLTFQYAVGATLLVEVEGVGALTPNYSNVVLNIGQNYTMTAAPGAGFVFSDWTISTNWAGGETTNDPTVEFMMASNLTLSANFEDVEAPEAGITNLTDGESMGDTLITVAGTASDNWQVAGVWCQVNTNGWVPAATTDGYNDWDVTNESLSLGTNSVEVYAVDVAGNYSVTNSLSVVVTNVDGGGMLAKKTVGRTLIAAPVVLATGAQMTAGGFQFNLVIAGAASGRIQSSTDMLVWNTATNFAGTNTTIRYCDGAATNATRKYYRAVVP